MANTAHSGHGVPARGQGVDWSGHELEKGGGTGRLEAEGMRSLIDNVIYGRQSRHLRPEYHHRPKYLPSPTKISASWSLVA